MPRTFKSLRDTYSVVRKLGEGANGITYLAKAKKTGTLVVVKEPKLDGVNDQDLGDRIERLNTFLAVEGRILPSLHGLNGVAQLIDQGYVEYRLGITVRFNVYQYIPGVNLKQWGHLYAGFKQMKVFRGIQEVDLWFKFATTLTRVLADVHTRKIVHGDLWHENVIVKGVTKEPFNPAIPTTLVLVDFGWAIALEQRSSRLADRSIWYTHWAPERVKHDGLNLRWYSPADIYSLGNMLLFLAVGECAVIPFRADLIAKLDDGSGGYEVLDFGLHNHASPKSGVFKEQSDIKAYIVETIARTNPELYKAFPSIAELVMFCMRPDVTLRAKHAGVVEQQLRALVPRGIRKDRRGVKALRSSAAKFNSVIARLCDNGMHPMLSRLVLNDIETMFRSFGHSKMLLLERQGGRDQMILDLTSCIGEAREGNHIEGVLALALLQTNNLGPTGRVIASLGTAANSGVIVRIVILVKISDQASELLQSLVGECRRRRLDLPKDAGGDAGALDIRVVVKDDKEYHAFIRGYGSFLMMITDDGLITIDADYDQSGGNCTALRFSSRTARGTDGRDFGSEFKKHFDASQPI